MTTASVVEPGWTAKERGELLASVGGGRHQRPLLPAEVGSLLEKELARGVTREALAKVLYLDSTAMIGRFTRLLLLPPEVRSAVVWGRSTTTLNLTQAQEIARLPNHAEMRDFARLALEFGLSGTEVRGAVQICLRRGADAQVGVEETVRMRPVIERRYIQLGRITEPDLVALLPSLTESQGSEAMRSVLHKIGLDVLDVSLRGQGYVLVLSEEAAKTADADDIEKLINSGLLQHLLDGIG